jgi:hypothetical protein
MMKTSEKCPRCASFELRQNETAVPGPDGEKHHPGCPVLWPPFKNLDEDLAWARALKDERADRLVYLITKGGGCGTRELRARSIARRIFASLDDGSDRMGMLDKLDGVLELAKDVADSIRLWFNPVDGTSPELLAAIFAAKMLERACLSEMARLERDLHYHGGEDELARQLDGQAADLERAALQIRARAEAARGRAHPREGSCAECARYLADRR